MLEPGSNQPDNPIGAHILSHIGNEGLLYQILYEYSSKRAQPNASEREETRPPTDKRTQPPTPPKDSPASKQQTARSAREQTHPTETTSEGVRVEVHPETAREEGGQGVGGQGVGASGLLVPAAPEGIDLVLQALQMTSSTKADVESLQRLGLVPGQGGQGPDLGVGGITAPGGKDLLAVGEMGKLSATSHRSATITPANASARSKKEYSFSKPVENLHSGVPSHEGNELPLPAYMRQKDSISQLSHASGLQMGAIASAGRSVQEASAGRAMQGAVSVSTESMQGMGVTGPVLGGPLVADDLKLLPRRPSSRPPMTPTHAPTPPTHSTHSALGITSAHGQGVPNGAIALGLGPAGSVMPNAPTPSRGPIVLKASGSAGAGDAPIGFAGSRGPGAGANVVQSPVSQSEEIEEIQL